MRMTDFASQFVSHDVTRAAERGRAVDQAVEQIDRALADLIGALGESESAKAALVERLHPVLRNPEPGNAQVMTADRLAAVPGCELAGVLLDRAARIVALAEQIRSDARDVAEIIGRLEI